MSKVVLGGSTINARVFFIFQQTLGQVQTFFLPETIFTKRGILVKKVLLFRVCPFGGVSKQRNKQKNSLTYRTITLEDKLEKNIHPYHSMKLNVY